jgi:hypothetical protein
MFILREKYMSSVDKMFNSFRPKIDEMFINEQYQDIIDYCYNVIPDCVPRVLTLSRCIKELDRINKKW